MRRRKKMNKDFKITQASFAETNLDPTGWVAFPTDELNRLLATSTKACDILDSIVERYSSLHIMLGNLKAKADTMGFDREAALYTTILESLQMKALHDDVVMADDFLIGDLDI
jgi:hypothetical protein